MSLPFDRKAILCCSSPPSYCLQQVSSCAWQPRLTLSMHQSAPAGDTCKQAFAGVSSVRSNPWTADLSSHCPPLLCLDVLYCDAVPCCWHSYSVAQGRIQAFSRPDPSGVLSVAQKRNHSANNMIVGHHHAQSCMILAPQKFSGVDKHGHVWYCRRRQLSA